MRMLSNERLLDVVAVLMVGAAAASSSSLSTWLKPSEFRAKSERLARLHQLQSLHAANSAAGRAVAQTTPTKISGHATERSETPMVVADAR